MSSPFYITGDHNTFYIVDVTDHTSYHFQIKNDQLYYIHDDQQYLVISELVSYTMPYYSFSVLVAYKEPSLDAIKQRPIFEYEINQRYIHDPNDHLYIKGHRCGTFLPNNPFTIHSKNTQLIYTFGSSKHIRAHIFRKLIIDHLTNNMPCQTCNIKYSRDAYETNISFNYGITHKCVLCATKDDGFFKVDIENFIIQDGDTMYKFILDNDGLYLVINNNKLLVVTHELEESMNPPDDGELHNMVYKYKVTPVVMVNDRLLPENPNQIVFGIKKHIYFRDTLIRLLHTQLCIKCKTSRNLKGMSIAEKEYWVHSYCQTCIGEVFKDAVNSVFSYNISGDVLTITLKESQTSYEFEVRQNGVWYHDTLVMSDDTLKESIKLPDKNGSLILPPVRNLLTKTSIEITIPYWDLFYVILSKIGPISS
jgi:hypothetical protein